MTPLAPNQIAPAVPSGWTHRADALHREFRFDSFRDAMSFMLRAAFVAEAHRHHPEWSNVYDCVTIRLTTHDAGNRVTERDVKLARAFDAIARSFRAPGPVAAD
jgi:4a-hydroxytetrahydrobiopterin dehydratase